jgi:sarcosine oxidase subunit beta
MNMRHEVPAKAQVVIIGGGIQGLATAYFLSELGTTNVVVLDAGYWQGGASGRNGTLIRGGFSSEEWSRFFAYSAELWLGLSRRLGENVMYSRRGYAMVAERTVTGDLLRETSRVHERCGIHSKLLSRKELVDVLPAITHDKVHSALYLPASGVAPHHAAMHAFHAACLRNGVKVFYRTPARAIERRNGSISSVHLDEGRIDADAVVIAAGAHCPDVARMAGVELEGYAMRLEAMALEPTRPLIKPAVALLDRLCYMHQTARGEVVGGAEVAERPQSTLNADIPVMAATAKAYLDMFPQLADARILRQWGGLVHISPDFGPMLGAHPAVGGLFITAGWCYGHAGAPAAGDLMAKLIAKGVTDPRIKPFAVDRFARSLPVLEPGIVLSHFD